MLVYFGLFRIKNKISPTSAGMEFPATKTYSKDNKLSADTSTIHDPHLTHETRATIIMKDLVHMAECIMMGVVKISSLTDVDEKIVWVVESPKKDPVIVLKYHKSKQDDALAAKAGPGNRSAADNEPQISAPVPINGIEIVVRDSNAAELSEENSRERSFDIVTPIGERDKPEAAEETSCTNLVETSEDDVHSLHMIIHQDNGQKLQICSQRGIEPMAIDESEMSEPIDEEPEPAIGDSSATELPEADSRKHLLSWIDSEHEYAKRCTNLKRTIQDVPYGKDASDDQESTDDIDVPITEQDQPEPASKIIRTNLQQETIRDVPSEEGATSTPREHQQSEVCSSQVMVHQNNRQKLKRLKVHKSIHTLERPYQCNECEMDFSQLGDLMSHRMIHTGERPRQHSCYSKKSPHSGNSKSSERLYQCAECKQTFTHVDHLKSHKKVHDGERPFQRPPSKDVNVHGRLRTSDKPHQHAYSYQCFYCGMKFIQWSELQEHEEYHTTPNRLQCTHCSRECTNSRSLTAHQTSHTGGIYMCSHCDKNFARQLNLKQHEVVHAEKPLACDQCGRKFSHWAHLARHQHFSGHFNPVEEQHCLKTFGRPRPQFKDTNILQAAL